MMLVICVPTYNRNRSLIRCLKSINNLYVVSNIKIKIIVVDNSAKRNSYKPVKKLKKIFKYQIIQLHEKRRGVVYARNRFLKRVKKINPKFICFFIISYTNKTLLLAAQLTLLVSSLYVFSKN